MKNLIFIIVSLFSLTACQWDLDKLDLDGNVYNCEETCVNGVCDELKNECNCSEGWGGKDCDVEVVTFEKVIKFSNYSNPYNVNLNRPFFGSFITSPDGNYILSSNQLMTEENGIANYYPILIKINSNGEVLWLKFYKPYTPTFFVVPFKVIQYENEILAIIGNRLMMIDSSGNVIWEKMYPADLKDLVLIDKDHLILVGDIIEYNNREIWVATVNVKNDIIWQTTYGGSHIDEVEYIAEAENGYLIACNSYSNDFDINRNNGSQDIILLNTNFEGELLWTKNYGGDDFEGVSSLVGTNTNSISFTGYTFSNNYDITENYGELDAWLVNVNQTGNVNWQKNYGGSKQDSFSDIVITNKSSYVLLGSTESKDFDVNFNNGGFDFWLVKVDSFGNIVWENTFGSEFDEFANVFISTLDGGYLLAGSTNEKDIYLVKTDANGDLQ